MVSNFHPVNVFNRLRKFKFLRKKIRNSISKEKSRKVLKNLKILNNLEENKFKFTKS